MYLKYSSDRSRNPASTPLATSPAASRKAPDGGSEGVMTGGTVTRNFILGKLTHSHYRELPCLFLYRLLGYVHIVVQ